MSQRLISMSVALLALVTAALLLVIVMAPPSSERHVSTGGQMVVYENGRAVYDGPVNGRVPGSAQERIDAMRDRVEERMNRNLF